jgi:hypothetical protein
MDRFTTLVALGSLAIEAVIVARVLWNLTRCQRHSSDE